MLAPLFAVGGGGEEAINEGAVGGGAGVVDEVVDFGLGGGEAGEIEGGAANERAAIRFGGGGEVLFFQLGHEKGIDGGVVRGWFLEGPPFG